ncbi:hypothetical protein Tco_0993979 [Tanacetum coccineum]
MKENLQEALAKQRHKCSNELSTSSGLLRISQAIFDIKRICVFTHIRGGGGEVKGGSVVFGVSRIEFGMILEDNMGKVVVKHSDLMEEPIDNWWVVREDDKEGTPVEGWRSNTDEH